MKFRIYYRKKLKISEESLCLQIVNIIKRLSKRTSNNLEGYTITVLGVSDTKYKKLALQYQKHGVDWHQELDDGLSDLIKNTPTAFGHVMI